MAEKKKKSIYSRKLKDVNKDGKRNFADTWLGDLIGADGKVGIGEGRPGLKDSLKGARREDGSGKKKAAKKKSSKTYSGRGESAGRTARDKTYSGRGETIGGRRAVQRDQGPTRGRGTLDEKMEVDRANATASVRDIKNITGDALTRAEAAKITYDQNRRISQQKRGPSAGESFTSWFQKNKEKYKNDKGGYNNAEALKDFNAAKRSGNSKGGMAKKKGYSKGGLNTRARTGHNDYRKGGMFR